MTPNEVEQIVRNVLRQEFGNYLASDGKIIIPKSIQSFGKMAGVYGQSVQRASAISAPNSPGAVYAQGDAISFQTSINQIRTALANFGITN